MRRIMIAFTPRHGRLNGREITARGLHGLLFALLHETNVNEATWLHSHPSPKPFSLAPLYTEQGELAGMRLTAINDRTADLLLDCWGRVRHSGRTLSLGRQKFGVGDLINEAGPTFADLAAAPAGAELGLRFLSPTAFKQGPGSLPLPLPVNVFSWPHKVWRSFAPSALALPEDWLDWCAQDIFVVQHQIQTATVLISQRESFTGFVGEVQFCAKTRHPQADLYLHVWQALARLAPFSGVGHKTTMGMGAVELVVSSVSRLVVWSCSRLVVNRSSLVIRKGFYW
jgi:CRISPR-associated endoribonuclease Cas6